MLETLLVASLVSLVGAALFQAVTNGLKLWQRSRIVVVEEDALIFFDKLARDLENSVRFSLLSFDGKSRRLIIPTRVQIEPEPRSSFRQDQLTTQLGLVEYSWDAASHAVIRRQSSYGEALARSFGPPQTLVTSVDAMRFRYFADGGDGRASPREAVSYRPLAVEVHLTLKDERGERNLSRFINLPFGGQP